VYYDAVSLLALRELPGVGERRLARLMAVTARRGEALRCVLEAPPARLAAVYGLPPSAIDRLCAQRGRHLARCSRLTDQLQDAGARLLVRGSDGYPAALERDLPLPPPLLFALGNAAILADPCVAILSSREVGDETVPATVAILRKATEERLSVAIGGMKTTHRLAAIAARALGAPRVVVLDRGLLAAFGSDLATDPFGSGGKRSRLDRATTLALSSFRPEDHAAPNSGRRRDEIIAALGDLLFASSARPGGEVERICLASLQRGKPVLVWRGANPDLIAAGARPLFPDSLAGGLRRLLERWQAPRPASRPAGRPWPRSRHAGRRRKSLAE
jgi:DNA processing protein